MSLLYHLERQITAEQLRSAGLDWLTGAGLVRGECRSGPAERGGKLVGDARLIEASRCRWEPDRQTWVPHVIEGVHVGLWTDAPPPTPEQLAREPQLNGHTVELLDGNQWLVPVARAYTEEDGELRWTVNLPQQLERASDGGWRLGDVVPKYRRLWEIAERWEAEWQRGFEAAAGEGGEETAVVLSLVDAADMAAEALAINYRVTAVEVGLLGLFATHTPAAVLDAVIDHQTRAEWIKKKAHLVGRDGTPIADGEPGSTVATDQQ